MLIHGFKIAENEFSFVGVPSPNSLDYILQYQVNTRTNEKHYCVMTKEGQIFELMSGVKHIELEDRLEELKKYSGLEISKYAAKELVDNTISVYNPQHELTGYTVEDIRVMIKRFSVIRQYAREQVNENREPRT